MDVAEGIALIHQIAERLGLRVAILPKEEGEESEASKQGATRRVGKLYVDFSRQYVEVAGKEVNLSATEYRLLSALVRNAGETLTLEQLYEEAFAGKGERSSHYLRMYIRLLRKRIEPRPDRPSIILTVRGKGYQLAVPEAKDGKPLKWRGV